ncbi:SDR family NAD(P)-dependent oxidoreductase [Streptomyces sp. NPDC046985]|uniref:SDR family NAD(P)-dependent oxidoreductase n=1 Tax=Streptomyces sp. NPDC046985 TaxID=3155377 RepID=UPI0033E178A2
MADATPPVPAGKAAHASLAGAVLAQARRTPEAPAVEDGDTVLDYAGLVRSASRVAERLRARGVGPGASVAVRLPRSWQLVSVMLGVRLAGAVVVPLDRLSPAERQRHILKDSGALAVVHDGPDLPPSPDHVTTLAVERLVSDEGEFAEPLEAPAPGRNGFVFYTSGSTGQPKGVEVTDAGVLRLAAPGYIRLAPGRRFGCLSNPAFDALSFEVWTPLLTGGTCVVLGERAAGDPALLAAELRARRVDTLFVTVALFNAVVDAVPDCFSAADQVLVGGEQLDARTIRRWYADNSGSRTVLHNVYGPTEATTFALIHPVPRAFDGDVVPVGAPLPGTGVRLRTEDGDRPARPGEVAELHLSGPALALGYRNLPEETGRRFISAEPGTRDGDEGAVRWYRTGDLVRQDADGLIAYVGRADRQVKVRGFRIECGEVERRAAAHPAVRRAFVCTRRTEAAGNELLAFLVLGDPLGHDAWERHLSAALPAYMRPHHTFLVDRLPLNANGKVDRDALLAGAHTPWRGDQGDDRDGADGLAADATVRRVLELAEEVLGAEGLRPRDRWISSGGDSLKGLRLRFELMRRFGADLPQELLLQADFAALADALRAPEATAGGHPPVPGAAGPSAPATSEQERLWLLARKDPNDRSYDVPLAFRIEGAVDRAALRGALRRLVERHPALRTRFTPTPQGLTQTVAEPYDPWAPAGLEDGESPEAAAERFCAPAFDLDGGRLLRAGWLPLADGGLLVLHLHHIAVDGWSLGVLFRDLTEDYAALLAGRPTAEPPHRPGMTEFAHWQRAWHGEPAYASRRERLLARYRAAGEASPPLEAADGPAPRTARLARTSLDRARSRAVDRLAARLGLTRFQVLVSAFAWAVYGVTGQTRPLIATPVANRSRPEFDATVGMFANTVLLPLALDGQEPLRVLLERHAGLARSVLNEQEVALNHVLTDRGLPDRTPLFDFLFVLENTDFSALRLPGCTVTAEHLAPLGAKCALTLSVVEHDGGLDCLWEHRDDFGADRAEAAGRLFREALDHLTEESGAALRALVEPYRRTLPDPGRGAPRTPGPATVADGFARQVRRTPDAPAVASGPVTLTYAELDARAAALAGELRGHLPADPATPAAAALYLAPSVEHVVAVLAAARLNLTVVPLDPSYPAPLLRHVLDQADPVCVLLTPDRADALDALAPPGLPRRLVVADAVPDPAAPPAPAEAPHQGLRPLYTLFTSGSTGTPKGVRVSDRTLCDLLAWQGADGGLGGAAVTQQFSMLSFDVSFQEIFSTLCSGGLLRLVRPEWRQDMPALLRELEAGGAERIFLPYVALQLLAEHGVRTGIFPSRLREVVTAGEQLVCTDAIRRWFAGLDGARLFNHYGPTETHVVSALCLEGDPYDWPLRPAIGRPVAGALLRVVDDGGLPVPPGVTGRLLIGGSMATRCYLGDAELNRTRFVDDPELGLFYRSGDLARFDADGLLHYAGREDGQIKLSGRRLELGQVEAALLEFPGVSNAVVAASDGGLVACLQTQDGADPDPAELDRHLAGLLPSFVRISRFRRLAALPRTPSGKLDRRAAPTAPGHDLRAASAAWTGSALERRLAALFEEATGRKVGVDQRFFDAGATSLDLMRFHLRCVGEGDLPFGVPDLFERVTVRALARLVADRAPDGHDDTPAGAEATSGTQRPAGTGRSTGTEQSVRTGPSVGTEPSIRTGPSVGTERSVRTGPSVGTEPSVRTGPSVGTERPVGTGRAPAPGGAVVPVGTTAADEPIAVVGMAVRLPGAADLAAFWELVVSGGRGIEHFAADDGRVGARSQLAGMLAFDAGRFTISPQEARLMDPQQRHLLMASAEALAHAGIGDPGAGRVGIVAACGENTYGRAMLRDADPAALPDAFRMALHQEKDFLATKAAYHLGLTGPAFSVQSACSSSLVGVHVAAGLLRQGDADVMLAGGVLVDPDLTGGYTYRPQHIFSPDGHCRPFSADAGGTVGASGAGVVVLKTLAAARRDGDAVYAVVTGTGLNNDGADKLGYSAPSLAGQRAALRTALARSGRRAAEVGYVEAHGTGTRLGDPVEAAALRQAYEAPAGTRLALSSVKSQLGHLGAAAGVVGLVRAVLAVHHGTVPPTVDFDRLNPQIEEGAFRVPTAAEPWPHAGPRVAAVSSFGIGGTNAHLVLEGPDDAPAPAAVPEPGAADGASGAVGCLVLSAASPAALRADAARIAGYLEARPDGFARVVRHLQAGRPALAHRAAEVCPDAPSAVAWLRTLAARAPHAAHAPLPAADLPEPRPEAVAAAGRTARELAEAWTAGQDVRWPAGPAQAPWDFPPPAFDLTEYDFPRAPAPVAGADDADGDPERTGSTGRTDSTDSTDSTDTSRAADGPERLPAARWLHQPQWVRTRRARTGGAADGRTAVLVTAPGDDPDAWRALERGYARVVRVRTGGEFARLADGYRVDPCDPAHLAAVLADVAVAGQPVCDWLHALPLAITGEVGETSLDTARWACLDTVAALCRALADVPEAARPAVWLLSQQAQAVTGAVRRPEAGLLAGAGEVPRQELGLPTPRWVDLPSADPARWADRLPALTADGGSDGPVALREGFWWRRELRPVAAPPAGAADGPPLGTGTHLILGGTGGIGATLAARLLRDPGNRVVLLARRAVLPDALAPWADRVALVAADLADEDLDGIAARLAPRLEGLSGVVHAAGTAVGSLLVRRDAEAAWRSVAAKLRGALLAERLAGRHGAGHVVLCSSMASVFGGVGQFDYAAANGLLDAFAQYRPSEDDGPAVRCVIGWDAWREVGMAQGALGRDARHQEHLTVALTPEEGVRVFEDALDLQLPHLLVSTTSLEGARRFYEPDRAAPYGSGRRPAGLAPAGTPVEPVDSAPGARKDPAAEVAAYVRDLLGVPELDPGASLYDLGADSLTLLELVDEVKARHGVDLDLSRLSHRVSLTEILDHLGTALHGGRGGTAAVEVEVWQRGSGSGSDVLCLVHPVGGDIQAYRPLVSALDARLTVCLIADPALRDPGGPVRTVEDRARDYLAALRTEFPHPGLRLSLGGWSFGAWAALSMASLAERDGRPVHGLYLLDPPPPGSGARAAAYDDREVDAVFARELSGDHARDLGARGRDYAERLARCCRANLAAMAEHRLPRLTGTESVVWLAERTAADVTPLAPEPATAADWEPHLAAPAWVVRVDADHYALVAPPHADAVAAAIGEHVFRPDPPGRPADRREPGAPGRPESVPRSG